MNSVLTSAVSLLPSLSWLTGPILDKELRVSSRRRRNYALRSAYIALLGLFIMYVWMVTLRIGGGGTASFRASQMAVAGRAIITTIIWFQFIVGQFVAIVMLSTSIGSEIRQRTLAVLMTTPISSLQIVAGKLLSRLLQIVLLLAISMPLLAILRVFGGVPWDYIVSSLCITLTAVVFAGSLSLLLSMSFRNGYSAVMAIVVGYVLVFAAVPGLLTVLARFGWFGGAIAPAITHVLNPFGALLIRTYVMFSIPGQIGAASTWPLHCAIMLAASLGVLALAVWRVRTIALTAAFGGEKRSARKKRKRRARQFGPINRIKGSPVVWRETRESIIRGSMTGIIAYALVVTAVIAAIACSAFNLEAGIALQFSLAGVLLFVAVLRMAVLSAASIPREKESRSWPILLATPLSDKEIMRGKGVAAFLRSMPILLLIVPLMLSFIVTALISREGPPLFILLFAVGQLVTMAASAIFVIGLGLYCGVRMKTTSAAVAVTVAAYVGPMFFCCGGMGPIFGVFFAMGRFGLGNMLSWLVPGCFHAVTGLLFAWRARCRLRRRIF